MAIMVTTGMAIMAEGTMGTEEGIMGAVAMEVDIMEEDTTAVAVVEDPTPVATVEVDNTPALDTVAVAEGSTLLLATAEVDSTPPLVMAGVVQGTGAARWLLEVVGTVARVRWLQEAEADVAARIPCKAGLPKDC
jgi:hypothetical protein